MKSIACTAIREAVRTRLNLPPLTTTGILTIQKVNALVIQTANELASMLRTGFGDGWNSHQKFDTLTGGTNTYDLLPLGAIDLSKVAWARSADDFVNLRAANIDQEFRGGVQTQSWQGSTPRYRMRGSNLEFYPTPSDDVYIVLEYTTDFQIPDDLSGFIEVENGWDEWIINETCARCAVIEKKDPALFMQSTQRIWENVIEPSFGRDEWKPQQVRDVMGYTGAEQQGLSGRHYRGY